MHVDMIFAHYSFQYLHVFRIADLNQKLTTSQFDVTGQHMIPVLRRPNQMYRQSRDSMTAVSILFHHAALLTCLEVCSN